jgi:DNA-binding XRE family transcriptional regulator
VPDAGTPVRDARRAAGLSQAALADAAGVSRQAVGAIEAGLHRPGVDAALAIARAVGRSAEDLFGAPAPPRRPLYGRALADGSPVLAARVGDGIVYAPAAGALAFEGWPAPNAVLDGAGVRLLPGADLDALLVVGCDPALALAASLLPASGRRHVIALGGSTSSALDAMRAGDAHGALVHNRADRLPAAPPGTLRLHLARWRVGVASGGARARSIAQLAGRRARVVQREPGASTQKAFETALSAQGASGLPGPIASGHVEVARRVVDGAVAGVTMEPAALQFGLAFTALEEHVVELWVDPRRRAHPAVDALAGVMRSAAFAARMDLVGGYELAGCGTERGPVA